MLGRGTPSVGRGRQEEAAESRTYPRLSSEAAESIEASGSVDVKTFIIGRKGTIGWATYESAVTESVFKRSVAKDAQNQYLCEVRAGSGIRRGTRNSKVERKSTGEVDISPFRTTIRSNRDHGSPSEVVSQQESGFSPPEEATGRGIVPDRLPCLQRPETWSKVALRLRAAPRGERPSEAEKS